MMSLKVLALAALSDRIGYVLLHADRVKDWQTSEKAAVSSVEAAAFAQEMINYHRPNVVVTERLGLDNRKGEATQRLIDAMERIAQENNSVIHVATEHYHAYPSKYEEAAALAKLYPALKPWLPDKRRIFDNQPRVMVIFEALSLAHSIARGGAEPIAAAMN